MNRNHPKKGSVITVDPIRSVSEIKRIKEMLSGRDLVLFTIGINNGLRISDLLKLKVEDVRELGVGETVRIREKKTGKSNVLMINGEVYRVLSQYLSESGLRDTDYLFQSRKGKNKPLTRQYVHQLMKQWTIGIKGNFGTHSLRKTFGWVQRKVFNVSWEVLCKRFGHSHPGITMRYLGISDEEVSSILMNEI